MKKYTMTGIVLVVLLLGMSTAVAYDSPTLVTYTITNTTIEPPQTTSIDVAFSEYVSATIEIENASGDLVKELYSSPKVKNPNAKIWNGTYTDGTTVPDDTYTVNVTGVNTTTGLSVINTSETITVVTSGDTTAPTVTANTPTGTDVVISTTISVTFSEAMNQTSAEDAFSISPAVNGSLGWDNDTMTFTPDADLAYDTTYNTTIGTGAEDLAGNALAADHVWDFVTESPETTTDTVTRTLQATAAPDDTIMVSLTIDFDDQAAVTYLAITETVPEEWAITNISNNGRLGAAGNKISWVIAEAAGGTIPSDGVVFTYNVTVPTDANGIYSFSGVYGTNVAGTGLDMLGDTNITVDGGDTYEPPTLVTYTITNRTITPPDGGDTYEPPTLVTYTITNRTITPPQTTSIDVEFSEYVSATIKIENASGNLVKELYNNSNVKNPTAKIWDGTYTDGTTVPDDTYTVNVTGVNTTTGLCVINTSETITVVTSGDTTAPTVTANTPTGTDVSISTTITATFSEAMNQTSAEAAFSISPAINGSLGWDNDTMTFTPDADLAYSTTYDVTIGTGAEDLVGNALEADFVWNFTTEEEADTTAPDILSATPSQNPILSNGADSTILTVHAYSGSIDMDIASVTVNLSAIGGPDEQELDGTQSMGTGTWSTTFNTTFVGTFDLTVNVTNDAGNSDTKDVTLTAAPYKYTLELKQGWNMISLPYNVTAVGIDTTQKLGDMITAAGVPCYSVAWFNATLQTMESDLINLPDDMPQDEPGLIVGGQAYFVFVADNKDVAVFGTLW
jgi:flagellar hook assembly protein FlgD